MYSPFKPLSLDAAPVVISNVGDDDEGDEVELEESDSEEVCFLLVRPLTLYQGYIHLLDLVFVRIGCFLCLRYYQIV